MELYSAFADADRSRDEVLSSVVVKCCYVLSRWQLLVPIFACHSTVAAASQLPLGLQQGYGARSAYKTIPLTHKLDLALRGGYY